MHASRAIFPVLLLISRIIQHISDFEKVCILFEDKDRWRHFDKRSA